MKKLFVLAIAALAMTFVSCGNKAKAPEAEVVDTVAVADAAAEAEATINALAENLESKDLNAFQTALPYHGIYLIHDFTDRQFSHPLQQDIPHDLQALPLCGAIGCTWPYGRSDSVSRS